MSFFSISAWRGLTGVLARDTHRLSGVPRSHEAAPTWVPSVGLCLELVLGRQAVSYERGTLVESYIHMQDPTCSVALVIREQPLCMPSASTGSCELAERDLYYYKSYLLLVLRGPPTTIPDLQSIPV